MDALTHIITLQQHVTRVALCLLQAAVKEAQAWLGGGTSIMGRAHQLGPHPYAALTLFPAENGRSKLAPEVKTPFQVGVLLRLCLLVKFAWQQ